jgi:prepilin-type N-terminal cleavage/methylation domain-containing protein
MFRDPIESTPSAAGYSLIEILVATAILGAIGVGVASFFENFEKSQTKMAARSQSTDQNHRLLEYVKRDFRYQTAYQVISPTRMRITRRQRYQTNNSDATYQVEFRSECATPPQSVRNILRAAYSSNNNQNQIQTNSNRCLQELQCPNGQYPQVRVIPDTTGPRIPSYQPQMYPSFAQNQNKQDRIRTGSIGTGLCFYESANKIRVVANSVFLGGESSGVESVSFANDEALLSKSNIAGVEIIPSDN